MVDSDIWSDKEKILRLAENIPQTLNDRVKKFLKDLFPKSDNVNENGFISYDDKNVTKQLELFTKTISEIVTSSEISIFLDFLLDLIIGHSVIREIFLKKDHLNTTIRQKLIELFTLICSNRVEYCRECNNLIDFILSSYRATLSIEDQTLLRLLSILELNGLNLQKYYPYIWGDNGAIFYASKHAQKLKFLRTPNIDEIFNGFDGKYLQNSVSDFPIDIRICDKPIEIIEGIESFEKYDPRFILPMFYHFISVQTIVKYHKFINYGCFTYVICSLSSRCLRVRSLAYRILARLYTHLDCAKYPQDKNLWSGLIDFIRSGLTEENQRIASVHTVLFARIIEVLLNPASLLYSTVRGYLVRHQMKPFNYKTVSPFYNDCLFEINGANKVSYMLHQKFVINWIMHSLKTGTDVRIWHRRHSFSDMLTYYNSPLCVEENKPLIMKMLITLATLPEGIKVLCGDCAIFTWINHHLTILPQFEQSNLTPKTSLYKLVVTMWNTGYEEFFKNLNSDTIPPFIFYESFCFELIMSLSKIVYKSTDRWRVDAYSEICRKSLKHTQNGHQRRIIKSLILSNLPMNLELMFQEKNEEMEVN